MANTFARTLRKNPTDAERRLWFLLREKKLGGFRFRRQQPIGPYVADFFCAPIKPIIELDGDQHGSDAGLAKDQVRTTWLQSRGYRVLRFPNDAVFKQSRWVLEAIWHEIENTPHPICPRALHAPNRPPPQGGR